MSVCVCVYMHTRTHRSGLTSVMYLASKRNRTNKSVCGWWFSGQVVSISRKPMDCSLPGSSVHGDSPGKNIGAGCHALLQGIFPTQGSNPGLLHCRQIILYDLSDLESLSLVCRFKTGLRRGCADCGDFIRSLEGRPMFSGWLSQGSHGIGVTLRFSQRLLGKGLLLKVEEQAPRGWRP